MDHETGRTLHSRCCESDGSLGNVVHRYMCEQQFQFTEVAANDAAVLVNGSFCLY